MCSKSSLHARSATMTKLFTACPDDPLRVRRHLAIAIIVQLEVMLYILLALAYWGGPNTAPVLSAAVPVLVPLVAGLLGLAGAWYHAAYRAPTQPGAGLTDA